MSALYDLIVIGGGPGGTSAAITAARAGWQVLLLERGRLPRHKVCGEFVSAEALALLKWLLLDAQQDLLQQAISLSESRLLLDGRTIRIPVSPPAASIARFDLDFALWSAAEKAGVTALQDTTVQRIEGDQPFRIQTAAGEFCARTLINASGRWSNLGRMEPPSNGSRWLGLKAHFHGEMEAGVDLYFFDGGYCGVQPVRGTQGNARVNVCALFRPSVAATFEELFRCHPLLETRSRSWEAEYPSLSTFPVTFRDPCPVSGHVFNVGDAAGFVDPFVGDGISLALHGGNLAARSLTPFLRGECELEASEQRYAQSYRRALQPVYRVSSLFRRLLRIPRPLRVPFLSACERSPRLARYLVEATRSRAAELV